MDNKNLSSSEEEKEYVNPMLATYTDEESTLLADSREKKPVLRKPFMGTFHQADKYIRDNEFILTGYRIGYNSVCRVLKTLFLCHNESVNIWTHLVGVLAFFSMIFYVWIFLTKGHANVETHFKYFHQLLFYLNDHTTKCDALLSEFGDFKSNLGILEANMQNEYYLNILNAVYYEANGKMHALYQLDEHVSKYCRQDIFHIANSLDTMRQVVLGVDRSNLKEVKYGALLCQVMMNELSDTYTTKYAINGITDGVSKIPLLLHIFCAMIWLFFSSLFHLFCWHSKEACTVLSRFDYGGIAILIAGSATPIYIYTFYWNENEYVGYIYTALINLACLAAFIISLIPRFDAPGFRKWRAVLFVIVGISAGVPGLHSIFFRNKALSPLPPYTLLLIGGGFYIVGAVIYSSRFPERCFRGKLDYIGNSHNIWHVLVLAGAATHFAASILTYLNRLDSPCPA